MDFPIKCPVGSNLRPVCGKLTNRQEQEEELVWEETKGVEEESTMETETPFICLHPLFGKVDLDDSWDRLPCEEKLITRRIFTIPSGLNGRQVFSTVLKRLKLCPTSHPFQLLKKGLSFVIKRGESDPAIAQLLEREWSSQPEKSRQIILKLLRLDKNASFLLILRTVYIKLGLNKPGTNLSEATGGLKQFQDNLAKLLATVNEATQRLKPEDLTAEMREFLQLAKRQWPLVPKNQHAVVAAFLKVPEGELKKMNGREVILLGLTRIGYSAKDTHDQILTRFMKYFIHQLSNNKEFIVLLNRSWEGLPIDIRTSTLNRFKLQSTSSGVQVMKFLIGLLQLDKSPLKVKEVMKNLEKLATKMPKLTEKINSTVKNRVEKKNKVQISRHDFTCSSNEGIVNCLFKGGLGIPPSLINITDATTCKKNQACQLPSKISGKVVCKEGKARCRDEGYAYNPSNLKAEFNIDQTRCECYEGTLLSSSGEKERTGNICICTSSPADSNFKLSAFLSKWLRVHGEEEEEEEE